MMNILSLLEPHDVSLNRNLIKFILIMKIFVLFTFISVLNATASIYSQSENISLSVKDATVFEVLNSIEQNTDFKFFYQNEQIVPSV